VLFVGLVSCANFVSLGLLKHTQSHAKTSKVYRFTYQAVVMNAPYDFGLLRLSVSWSPRFSRPLALRCQYPSSREARTSRPPLSPFLSFCTFHHPLNLLFWLWAPLRFDALLPRGIRSRTFPPPYGYASLALSVVLGTTMGIPDVLDWTPPLPFWTIPQVVRSAFYTQVLSFHAPPHTHAAR